MSLKVPRPLRNCAKGLLALVLCLLALEVGVRLSGRADALYTDPAFEASARGDYWTYRPGFEGQVLGRTRARIGPLGTRLNGSTAAEPVGKVAIAVFGDSFTFGQGVDQEHTFSGQLEKSLRNAALPAEVLNFGVQGHTLEMEVAHASDRLPQVNPRVVVLAFLSDDLYPDRAHNHVDRFGYLTKDAFGPPSYWQDLVRAGLRRSHAALLAKDVYLNLWVAQAAAPSPGSEEDSTLEPLLTRFRTSMRRFDDLTAGLVGIAMCVDTTETPLTRRIRNIMEKEFPRLPYLHAPTALAQLSPKDLLIPGDGHPN